MKATEKEYIDEIMELTTRVKLLESERTKLLYALEKIGETLRQAGCETEIEVPRLGETVYLTIENSINVDKVFALAKEGFFVGAALDKTVKDMYKFWKYADFGKKWFTDFEGAKECVMSNYKPTMPFAKLRLTKMDEGYYEVEEVHE